MSVKIFFQTSTYQLGKERPEFCGVLDLDVGNQRSDLYGVSGFKRSRENFGTIFSVSVVLSYLVLQLHLWDKIYLRINKHNCSGDSCFKCGVYCTLFCNLV